MIKQANVTMVEVSTFKETENKTFTLADIIMNSWGDEVKFGDHSFNCAWVDLFYTKQQDNWVPSKPQADDDTFSAKLCILFKIPGST